jgi:hypothetical protein
MPTYSSCYSCFNFTANRCIRGHEEREVTEKLAKVLSDRADGIIVDDKNLTVGEYLDRWLSHVVRGTRSESQPTPETDT